ncbi:immunoglobulin domain-containing protein [Horticoccus luteus]|uniref:Immunoglobulin domain-containing protein n=1 Tax=Horticoccus luteus TaxID=2862869 RepID=A0A8F9TUL3_9BACT|nr:immunoglobulin domain-containing protein [Horticoccus luteus]QYM79559.1 immunoglobulin domain-containing protein [Horticoccus luteus]
MNTSKLFCCWFSALAALAGASLGFAGGGPYMIQKVQTFTQTSGAGAVADLGQPYSFRANSLVESNLHLPDGSTQTLVLQDEGGGEVSYGLHLDFANQAALDAAYPNGIYTITGTGIPTLSFNLTGNLYPTATPQITNGTWSNGGLLVINPNTSTTLNLSNFSTYATAGVAGHMSLSLGGNNVDLSQDILTQAAFDIDVSATPFTSVTVPAGSLTEGRIYNLQLDFDTATTFDLMTMPDSGVIALYEKHLDVWVVALADPSSAPPVPTISQQPANQTGPLGGSATFTAMVNTHTMMQGDSRTAWYFNGAEIRFDNNSTKYHYDFVGGGIGLTVNNITQADVGVYSLKFVNAGGIAASVGATLAIGAAAPPVITAQPIAQMLNAGQSAFFSVSATGSSLSYQWTKDGVALPGATSATLNLNGVQVSDAGDYAVAIVSDGGTIVSDSATLTVFAAPVITAQPTSVAAPTGGVATFTVSATGGPAPAYRWAKNNVLIDGATNASLTLTNLQSADAGDYAVTVANDRGTVVSNVATLTVTTTPSLPVFVAQPADASDVVGGSVTLTVTVNALPAATYQWLKNATPIAGATNASLVLTSLQSTDAGTYAVVATNSQGSTTSANAIVTVGATNFLSNLSVRAAMTQGQTLIMGFVVGGGAKPVLVRVAGPALNTYGLTGVADPHFTLYDEHAVVAGANEDWDSTLAPLFMQLGAFPFLPGSKDAAMQATITGPYTAQASGTGNGTVLVEAYDAGTNNGSRLTNVSARYHVGTGNDILIAGFAIAGTGTKQVLIRAVGPTLAGFGVPGVLADPQFTVYDQQGAVIASNDNWDASLDSMFTTLGAFTLTPASKDAAALVTLDAGKTYTVQVSGVANGTGEALIEVYDAQP